MSWQATDAVRRHSRSKRGARTLLLCIASYAGPDGSGAFPGLQQLCDDTNASERAVRYQLRELERLGELETLPNAGPHGVNVYRVILPGVGLPRHGKENARRGGASFAPPAEAAGEVGQVATGGGASSRRGGAKPRAGVGQVSAPEPSGDPPEEPPGEPREGARAGATLVLRAIPEPGESAAAARAADPTWRALVAAAGGEEPLDGEELARWEDAAATLRRRRAPPEEIARRAAHYRRRWPGKAFTPRGLVANWTALAEAPKGPDETDRRRGEQPTRRALLGSADYWADEGGPGDSWAPRDRRAAE